MAFVAGAHLQRRSLVSGCRGRSDAFCIHRQCPRTVLPPLNALQAPELPAHLEAELDELAKSAYCGTEGEVQFTDRTSECVSPR